MTASEDSPLHIVSLAGEPSGDLLGGRLMAALRAESEQPIRFTGVGGPAMIDEGLDALYAMEEFAVMGLVEVLPHILRIQRRITNLVRIIAAQRPAALVTIDSPAFTLAVAKRLRGQGIPLIHYVAPSVWAWKPWRAKAVAGYLDKLLALLPFEPPHFTRHGLDCVFVGHPACDDEAEAVAAPSDGRARLGLRTDERLLCLLPGSRRGEITRMLPVFTEVATKLSREQPALQFALPTLQHLADEVRRAVADLPIAPMVLVEAQERRWAIQAADAALAASGTVVVELASRGVPSVVAHRVNPVTSWLLHRLMTVRWVSLPNIVLDQPVIPELFQDSCRAEEILPVLRRLLDDPAEREAQRAAMARFRAALRPPGPAPSHRAAREVLATIAAKPVSAPSPE